MAGRMRVEVERDALKQVGASGSTEFRREGVVPRVHALLMDDGCCVLHIVREDGSDHCVNIDSPATRNDGFTL